jgi:hypothetical protein
MPVLRNCDEKENGHVLIEEIPSHGLFRTKIGRTFKKGEKLRKRYHCQEVGTTKVFLFSPV